MVIIIPKKSTNIFISVVSKFTLINNLSSLFTYSIIINRSASINVTTDESINNVIVIKLYSL